MFAGSYNCGWLQGGDCNEAFVIKWGNCKSRDAAKNLMADVLQKQGERPVLFYDKEIPREGSKSVFMLTADQYADIMATAEKWH
jgi:hypothetical protein